LIAAFPGGQAHDRVGHGEFRQQANVGVVILADPQRGDRERAEPSSELMQELAELGRTVGEGVQGPETIDHDEPGAVLLQDAAMR